MTVTVDVCHLNISKLDGSRRGWVDYCWRACEIRIPISGPDHQVASLDTNQVGQSVTIDVSQHKTIRRYGPGKRKASVPVVQEHRTSNSGDGIAREQKVRQSIAVHISDGHCA